jgi:hypothetical protein
MADFVEAEDVHAAVMCFDFDISIPRSIPLIDDFDDLDPTLAPIKTSRWRLEIRMRVNLNAHGSLFYLTIGAAA